MRGGDGPYTHRCQADGASRSVPLCGFVQAEYKPFVGPEHAFAHARILNAAIRVADLTKSVKVGAVNKLVADEVDER
jgi:hypothetical protein